MPDLQPAWDADVPEIFERYFTLKRGENPHGFYIECICGEIFAPAQTTLGLMIHLGSAAHCGLVAKAAQLW